MMHWRTTVFSHRRTMKEETQTHQDSRAIGLALGKALAVWALLYLVVIHLHVVWTWPEPAPVPPPGPSQQELDAAAKLQKAAAAAAAAHRATERRVKRLTTERHLQQAFERLESDYKDAQTLQADWLEATKQKLSLVQHNIHQLSKNVPKQDEEEALVDLDLPSLKSLLSTPSLDQYETQQQLRVALEEASDEVRNVLLDQQEISWNRWKEVFQAEYERRVPAPRQCKSTTKGQADVVSPDTARESDLFSSVRAVEAALKQRTKLGVSPLISSEATERVLEILEDTIISQQQEHRLAAAEREAEEEDEEDATPEIDESNCVSSQDVEWLVDEGLNALQRHQDLRAVLERALQEIDDSDEQVILDAVLLSPNSKNDRGSSNSENINLRHVLDTPLISQKSPQWVDVAVDHVSGHVDIIDQTLDRLVSEEDNGSVGRVLVSKLLKLASKVSFPNPYRNMTTKAGILMP